MDIVALVKSYYLPSVFVLCLCWGYIMKKFLPTDNKYIPAVLYLIGTVASFLKFGATFEALVAGGFTGLASIGFHQLFKQVIEHPRAGGELGSNYAEAHEKEDPADAPRFPGDEVKK